MFRRLVLTCAAFLCSIPTASAQTAGRVGRLLPAGFVTHENATAEAKVAGPVFWNDFLRTNEQGRMRVDLEDGSLLTVGAKSELRVVKHDAASQQSSIDLLYGKVRATVAPVTKPGGSFQRHG
jgi:ferric-dicitrate binding protein FerR (iron transport regulator)